jgi:endonuclease/exonuclease/phosphatase family metal-dependent hydrolase
VCLAALRLSAATALVILGACRTGRDYSGAGGPRYFGAPPVPPPASPSGTLRIVSFNIAFARNVDRAIALLTSEPTLGNADVILLQEMDAPSTQRIASAMRMGYVYYPAILHRRTRRDFGNAILSRFPMVEDARITLPNASRYAGTHRIATAATLRIGASRVRVYSTHLGTVADISSAKRRDQLRAIIADAARYPLVVIGGDLNSSGIGNVALEAGYAWPTRQGPRTTRFGRWDHIFVKGLKPPDSAASGTVVESRGVSDHHPIWAAARIVPGVK